MSRIMSGVIAVLVVCVSLLGLRLTVVSHKADSLKLEVSQAREALVLEGNLRVAESLSLQSRVVAAEAARIHTEKVNAATSKALAANPHWAAERVPDDVIDALGL